MFFDKLFNNNSNKSVNYNNFLSLYLKNNNMTLDNFETIFIVDQSFVINENNCKTIKVTGKVVKGHIKIGDTLYYVNENLQLISVNILGIEGFRQQFSEAYAGDNRGLKVDILDKLPTFSTYLYLFKK